MQKLLFFFKTQVAHIMNSCSSLFERTKAPFLIKRRAAVGPQNNDSSYTDYYNLFRRVHYILHLLAVVSIYMLFEHWRVFMVLFLFSEIIVFILMYLDTDCWLIRPLLTWSVILLHYLNALGEEPVFIVESFFSSFSCDLPLVGMEDILILYDNGFYYCAFRWAVLTAPYYCMGLILLLPLLSAFIALGCGFLLGYVYVARISTALNSIAAAAAAYILFAYPALRGYFLTFSDVNVYLTGIERWIIDAERYAGRVDILERTKHLNLELDFGEFISTTFLRAGFEFVIDSVSIVMLITITTISSIVHLYSIIYMRNDPHATRFFGLLSMFTFFMILLVSASNLVMLYIGWEGVGLTSFLLISFWYTRVPALKAATKAILMNKIGDMFLIAAIGIIALYTRGFTSNILVYPMVVPAAIEDSCFDGSSLTNCDLIALLLLVAAFVKSAQLFFHTWLPDAMEGPTPVSALLHAATMVTAGVYLVIRFSYMFEYSTIARSLMLVISFITIIFSSLVALTQYDIKKIIAYSTCSQLGLMFFACGLSAYHLALFHFFNHAFFKCSLFLLAGVIIHELGNEQDIRKMGALRAKMPVTFICFCIASLSLAGFPGYSGAVSKDLILALSNFIACDSSSMVIKVFLFSANISIVLTVFYSFRLVYYIFIKPMPYGKSWRRVAGGTYEDAIISNYIYGFIFAFLSIMSIVGGRLFKSLFILTEFRFVDISHEIVTLRRNVLIDALGAEYRLIGFLVFVQACVCVYMFTQFRMTFKVDRRFRVHVIARFRAVHMFFNKKGYFDDIYNMFIVRPLIELSRTYSRGFEDSIVHFMAYTLPRLMDWPHKYGVFSTKNTILHHVAFIVIPLAVLVFLSFL